MAYLIGHLRKKKEFEAVFSLGRSSFNQIMGIKVVANNLSESRVGIVISNKVSKKAVVRNRLRRRLRYIIAKHADHMQSGKDMVVIMLPAALGQPFADLEKSFLLNVRRLKIDK